MRAGWRCRGYAEKRGLHCAAVCVCVYIHESWGHLWIFASVCVCVCVYALTCLWHRLCVCMFCVSAVSRCQKSKQFSSGLQINQLRGNTKSHWTTCSVSELNPDNTHARTHARVHTLTVTCQGQSSTAVSEDLQVSACLLLFGALGVFLFNIWHLCLCELHLYVV